MHKHLLPIGFYDLLNSEAQVNQATINTLMGVFYEEEYQLIKTPLVEFEDSFCNDVNSNYKINEQVFKVVDDFSGKTMVLRNDITPQIARLMATKLQSSKLPLRLCYVGDVLKTQNNNNLYADRQLTQTGIELIGDDKLSSDLEVISLVIRALEKIEFFKLKVCFCCPRFLDMLLEDLKIEDSNVKTAIINKDISALDKLARAYSIYLIPLTLESDDLDRMNSILLKLPISRKVRCYLLKWQRIVKSIRLQCKNVKVSMDVFGDDEFSYHNQVGFTILAEGFVYPIARGGRYFINKSIPAVGATVYVSDLQKILIL